MWWRWTGNRQRRQVRKLWRWSTVGVVATTAGGFRIATTAAAAAVRRGVWFFVTFHQFDRVLAGIVAVGTDEVVVTVHRVVLLLFTLLGFPLGIRGEPAL